MRDLSGLGSHAPQPPDAQGPADDDDNDPGDEYAFEPAMRAELAGELLGPVDAQAADEELAPVIPAVPVLPPLPHAPDFDWSVYDSFLIRRPPPQKWPLVVLFNPDGTQRPVGELQTVGSVRYQMVAHCKVHAGCSRMRAWKMTKELPAHLEWVLIKWLTQGAHLAGKAQHEGLPKD